MGNLAALPDDADTAFEKVQKLRNKLERADMPVFRRPEIFAD